MLLKKQRRSKMKEFNCFEHCPKPGYCCREFSIDVKGFGILGEHDSQDLLDYIKEKQLPFVLSRYDEEFGAWRVTCPKLNANGRCDIYNQRPKICRDYQPQQDSLCCIPKATVLEYICQTILLLCRKFSRG